jgi:hypothetical protein
MFVEVEVLHWHMLIHLLKVVSEITFVKINVDISVDGDMHGLCVSSSYFRMHHRHFLCLSHRTILDRLFLELGYGVLDTNYPLAFLSVCIFSAAAFIAHD